MTAPRDIDRLVAAFLDEGQDELPDRSYDAVRAAIDHTRQRVVIGPWREGPLSRYATFGIAAVGTLLVAVVGINLLRGDGGIGGTAVAPTPSSSASPSPTPTAAAAQLPAAQGASVTAGTYSITDTKVTNVKRLTFTVPAGWSTADFVAKDAGTAGEVQFGTWVVSHVFTDACKWSQSSIVNAGTTTDQLVTVLAAQKSRTASAVTDTTVAGYPAKRIELTVSPTLDTASCTDGNLRYWPDPGPDFSGGSCCNRAGNIDAIYGVDIAGQRMVIVARHYPGASAQNLAELQSIVDSIRITP
jgi:hypothetical protein